jgi:hypothetical protein
MLSLSKLKSWLIVAAVMKSGHTVADDSENQSLSAEKGCIPLDEQEVDQSSLLSGSKKSEECNAVLSTSQLFTTTANNAINVCSLPPTELQR